MVRRAEQGSRSSVITFRKQRAKDLLKLSRDDILLAGIVTKSEIGNFLSHASKDDGVLAFVGRTLFGLTIRIRGFGQGFTIT
jgi:hypothetical protein